MIARPTRILIGRAATDQPQSPVAIGSASTNAMPIQTYIAKASGRAAHLAAEK
jgi:hypothetical protein